MNATVLHRVSLDTRNFHFEAFGTSAEHALSALRAALTVHVEQHRGRVASTWVDEVMEDVEAKAIEIGVGYRDGDRLGPETAGVALESRTTSPERTCLATFVALVESAGGASRLAHHGAELGPTVFAVKLQDAIDAAREFLA
ncbi:hypothetical protein [Variovorax gossypii]